MSKRDKRSRLRGHRGGGYGARKKHRGSGSKGGKGMAGTGKKAGQKIIWVMKYMPNYLGRKGKGFVSLNQKKKSRLEEINLDIINKKIEEFSKKGLVKKTKEGLELNLEGYKILGAGNLKEKIIIKASAFSENAKEKISSSGSKAVLIGDASEEKSE